jgi:tRNA modification GTPase
MINNILYDTVCAISTAPGTGGIAVIRISGNEAFKICDKIFTPLKEGKQISTQKPYSISYGNIVHGDEIIDNVLVSVYHAPHSYTGENTVEIACHGSLYIQQRIMQLLIDNGCRGAMAGEFTQRAFMNGKMDLSQAEAVADLIASTSSGMHKLAMNQMRGGFSAELSGLRDKLLHFTSMIELELDFGDHEELEFADRTELKSLAGDIYRKIKHLSDSFSVGNAIKNGIPVAIVGETNAGKSTLLNHLLNDDKAIISEIHGTTRDSIEDTVNIRGITFRFIDTAGIRETSDEIEILGIERTYNKIRQAAIVVWIIDSTHFDDRTEKIADKIIPIVKDKQLIIVFNKVDRLDNEEQVILDEEFMPQIKAKRLYISAKYKQNTENLERLLLEAANIPEINNDDVIVINIRHYEALTRALPAIERVIGSLDNNISGDFISQDLRECIHHLSDIVGEVSSDDVLANIFKNFCIGK